MSLMFIGHVNADYPGNRSLEFDGVDDHIGFSGVEAEKFTIEVWVKPKYRIEAGSDSAYKHETGFLVSIGYGVRTYFDYVTGAFKVTISYRPSSPFSYIYIGTRRVWETSWYHISVSYDDTTIRCYVNTTIDMLTKDDYAGYSIAYLSSDGRIGTAIDDATLAFGGSLDEVRCWNISRSSDEITQTFNRTLSETEINSPNLVGYWRLDDDANATSCRDSSLRKIDAQLGASPSTPLWRDNGAPIVPEFPSFLVLPTFIALTLLAVIIYKRKHTI